MLGMMQNKGGGAQPQMPAGQPMPNKGGAMSPSGTGTNQGLAALFQNNSPVSSGGPTTTMPQITAPQRPVIQPPAPHPNPLLQQQPAAVDDAAAKHLAMLQDAARQSQRLQGDPSSGRMINWNTKPQWVRTGGRNAG